METVLFLVERARETVLQELFEVQVVTRGPVPLTPHV